MAQIFKSANTDTDTDAGAKTPTAMFVPAVSWRDTQQVAESRSQLGERQTFNIRILPIHLIFNIYFEIFEEL